MVPLPEGKKYWVAAVSVAPMHRPFAASSR